MGGNVNQPAAAAVPSPARGSFRRGFVTLVILLVILWAFVFFALRTKGGLDLVRAQLEKRLGTPVTLEQARLGFPLTLHLAGLQSADYVAGQSGFRADAAAVSPGFRTRTWWRLELRRPELTLVYDGSAWAPTNFAGLGHLPESNLAVLSDLCAGWRDRLAVEVHGGSVVWQGGSEALPVYANGVEFRVEPVRLPGRRMVYYHFGAALAQDPHGNLVNSAEVEWLASDAPRLVELSRSASVPDPSESPFWGGSHDGKSER